MRELDVVGVRVEQPTNQPLVLLRETEGARYLPIWIGPVEASAIASAHQGIVAPRPQTHDLVLAVLDAVDDHLDEVRIVAVEDGIFRAELRLASGAVVDARPSDAIAVALKVSCRILCIEDVLDVAGIVSSRDEDAEIERFREFLDEIQPEDFEG